jgi:hypothetical protein
MFCFEDEVMTRASAHPPALNWIESAPAEPHTGHLTVHAIEFECAAQCATAFLFGGGKTVRPSTAAVAPTSG